MKSRAYLTVFIGFLSFFPASVFAIGSETYPYVDLAKIAFAKVKRNPTLLQTIPNLSGLDRLPEFPGRTTLYFNLAATILHTGERSYLPFAERLFYQGLWSAPKPLMEATLQHLRVFSRTSKLEAASQIAEVIVLESIHGARRAVALRRLQQSEAIGKRGKVYSLQAKNRIGKTNGEYAAVLALFDGAVNIDPFEISTADRKQLPKRFQEFIENARKEGRHSLTKDEVKDLTYDVFAIRKLVESLSEETRLMLFYAVAGTSPLVDNPLQTAELLFQSDSDQSLFEHLQFDKDLEATLLAYGLILRDILSPLLQSQTKLLESVGDFVRQGDGDLRRLIQDIGFICEAMRVTRVIEHEPPANPFAMKRDGVHFATRPTAPFQTLLGTRTARRALVRDLLRIRSQLREIFVASR